MKRPTIQQGAINDLNLLQGEEQGYSLLMAGTIQDILDEGREDYDRLNFSIENREQEIVQIRTEAALKKEAIETFDKAYKRTMHEKEIEKTRLESESEDLHADSGRLRGEMNYNGLPVPLSLPGRANRAKNGSWSLRSIGSALVAWLGIEALLLLTSYVSSREVLSVAEIVMRSTGTLGLVILLKLAFMKIKTASRRWVWELYKALSLLMLLAMIALPISSRYASSNRREQQEDVWQNLGASNLGDSYAQVYTDLSMLTVLSENSFILPILAGVLFVVAISLSEESVKSSHQPHDTDESAMSEKFKQLQTMIAKQRKRLKAHEDDIYVDTAIAIGYLQTAKQKMLALNTEFIESKQGLASDRRKMKVLVDTIERDIHFYKQVFIKELGKDPLKAAVISPDKLRFPTRADIESSLRN